ncbi:MAG: hypothetical protein AB7S83_00230 [Candidatus Methanomethylophilaceae archaeon]
MVRADLIDSEGNALVGQDFANDEDVIHYSTSTIDGVTAYNISAIPRLNWRGRPGSRGLYDKRYTKCDPGQCLVRG